MRACSCVLLLIIVVVVVAGCGCGQRADEEARARREANKDAVRRQIEEKEAAAERVRACSLREPGCGDVLYGALKCQAYVLRCFGVPTWCLCCAGAG